MGSERLLDQSYGIGPVSLANRAVFVVENFGIDDEDGDLSSAGFDWLVEQARNDWGMLLVGLDTFGSPRSDVVAPETLARLQEATRGVEIGVAVPGGWSPRLAKFAAAGIRWFELGEPPEHPLPDGTVCALRISDPTEVGPRQWVDVVHLGPTSEGRLDLVGGTLRQPYGYELENVPKPPGVPLMFSGRVKDPVAASRVLEYYGVSLVGIGRGAIAAPAMLDRWRRGEDWMPCTGCMACLAPSRFDEVGCAVSLVDDFLPYGESSWDIVGTSHAAVMLALALHERGHDVVVYDAEQAIGGVLRRRGRVPQQAESMEAAVFLRGRVRDSGLEVRRGFPETLDGAHTVVSLPESYVPQDGWPEEDWLDGLSVLGDTLHEKGPFEVWGDTLLAAELAAFFAMTAREVRLVCDPEFVASDTHPAWRRYYAGWFERHSVSVGPSSAASGQIRIAAGRQTRQHPAVRALREARTDALVVPDAYEPFRQREALELAFRLARRALA